MCISWVINTLQYDARYTQCHINTLQYDARYTQRRINTLQYDARYTQRHINTLQYDARYIQHKNIYRAVIRHFLLRKISPYVETQNVRPSVTYCNDS